MLLPVEDPKYGNAETVLRSLDELQPGGTVSHVIPHRPYVAYTFFQGGSRKSCVSVQACCSSKKYLPKAHHMLYTIAFIRT